MSLQLGLTDVDKELTHEDMNSHEKMSKILEEQKPSFPVGTASGYHALTIGWLTDQLIRRTDPKHRGIGQFFREEFATKYGW